MTQHHKNPNYIHHQSPGIAASLREIVFGVEDGMVSTMGAVTGIAVGTGSHFVIVLSGVVIVAVESISMAVGSYLSSKSQREVHERMIEEERGEILQYPKEEKEEMHELFVKDGWPHDVARQMSQVTAKDRKLMLREMCYRELHVSPSDLSEPLKNGLFMWGSYILGGAVPLVPYILVRDVYAAIAASIGITLVGLFLLGVYTTKFSKRSIWRAGGEMMLLAGLAAAVGFLVGQAAEHWIK